MTYQPGHIKRDPETSSCALRTAFPDEGAMARMAWLVSSTTLGARNAATSEVLTWQDVYTPKDGS